MPSLLIYLPPIPIFFQHLIILLVLIKLPSCLGSYNGYSSCAKLISCGNITIGFPFWGEDRPKECGHPLMQLTCDNEISHITINDVTYQVLEANPDSHTLTITREDYLLDLCQPKHVSTSLDTELYLIESPYKNLTLFYGCTPPSSLSLTPIPCNETSVEYVYSQFRSLLTSESCSTSVVVPVPPSLVEINDFIKVHQAIIGGFVVRWIVGIKECGECEKLNGVCGIDGSSLQTTCYCKDGPCSNFSPNLKESPGKSNKVGVVIGVSVGGVAVLVVILGCVYFMVQRRRKIVYKSRSMELFIAPTSSGDTFASTTNTSQSLSSYQSSKSDPVPRSYYFGVQVFTYEELEEATKNFDPSRELGEGGFGTVYKGELNDGRIVAVKRHYESNSRRIMQFMNEIQILAGLRHKNLVTLFGCTSKHSRELLLVYEFIPNGTVAYHLQGRSSKSTLLPWHIRLNIAIETAEALAYLHAKDVIHRDVKTNNLLLDDQFRVKVADFGLSRDFPNHVTHVSTAPQGTPGYVDPEYYQCYQLTDKSDVYSFGVVLVELISSLQAVDINRNRSDVNLSNMAVNKIQNQELHELVDPYLGFERDHAIRRMTTAVAELAFRCLQQEREMRPCMDEVVEILRGIKSDGFGAREETEVLDIKTDEVILLKKAHSPVSPHSVVDKWVSGSSVSNSS